MMNRRFSRLISVFLATFYLVNLWNVPIFAAVGKVVSEQQNVINESNNAAADISFPSVPTGDISSFDLLKKRIADMDVKRAAEYGAGGVAALGLFLTILFTALPANINSLVDQFIESKDVDATFKKMGGTQEFFGQYNRLCSENEKAISDAFNEFESFECKINNKDLSAQTQQFITSFKPNFPFGSLSDACFAQVFRIMYLCYLPTTGTQSPISSYKPNDIYIFFSVYGSLMDKYGYPKEGLSMDDEAKVYYVYWKSMRASDEYKGKLRQAGMRQYFNSRLFSDVPDEARIDPEQIVNEWLLAPNTPNLSANDWFTRLGGASADVQNYLSRRKQEKQVLENVCDWCDTGSEVELEKFGESKEWFDEKCKCLEDIRKDLSRTHADAEADRIPDVGGEPTDTGEDPAAEYVNLNNDTYRNQVLRIIYLYYSQDSQNLPTGQFDFAQGECDIFLMVYYKFLESKNCFGKALSGEDEAKVYYIFSKLMGVLAPFKRLCGRRTFSPESQQLMNKTQPEKFIKSLAKVDDKVHYFNLYNGPDYPSAGVSMMPYGTLCTHSSFNRKALLSLWDRIIADSDMYDGSNSLSSDKVLDLLHSVLGSSMLLCYKNTALRKHLKDDTPPKEKEYALLNALDKAQRGQFASFFSLL